MVDTLKELKARNLPFAIATTSPKPRVPASVHSCGLDDYFPPDKIHSGESDFDPPRFKPDPSVYLKARSGPGFRRVRNKIFSSHSSAVTCSSREKLFVLCDPSLR